MNREKVIKAYSAEYKALLTDIRSVKISDIFFKFRNSTKIGITILKLFPKMFEIISR
jgi:hypothetical protein